ncbi:hypothetical protein OG746_37120 [Streptomyces sp. NBC_01016]|uniref:alpha-L-rhamnosidase C-terminal domain-containing protein n=1 Tax=Streptomyces sp. NBC_01016 TaxID=2903720 RepID=UPI00224F3EAE|nr:alpha-L-rhamnosidase C-terminal domain-containing protein [Streptomyces sp. NBC_01016]MCX4834350.1 hypothetical protein [Streptomyces sp. NBC_01016]
MLPTEDTPGTDWRRYVRGPGQPTVRPVAVVSVSGDVIGADTLVTRSGSATLTMAPGGPEASLVLDYGQNVAGIPFTEVTSATGGPTLRLSYSESAAWADAADGDIEGSHNDTGNHDRVETFHVDAEEPTTLSSGLIQGGQRYQRIALTSPGTLVISDIGMRYTAYRATAEDYQGWFACSSDLLNQVWYDGAYTVQLNQLPARTLPLPWSVSDGSLLARGGHLAVLNDGADWSDGTIAFRTQVVDRSAGWIVRASDEGRHGYLFVLRAADGPDHPAHLEQLYVDDGHEDRPQDNVRRYTPLGRIPLEKDPGDGNWHDVRTTMDGALITVAIDGRTVCTLDTAQLPDGVPARSTGSFGFHQAWGFKHRVEQARLRDLRVTGPDGSILYEDPLADATALDAFNGDAVRRPNPLPVILDGGKRDRTVWSGDLLVQIPTVFCTTGAEDYVRGSLELLNSYQEASGQSAARVPPVLRPATGPQHGQTYSAVYSLHQLVNLALHHLYTADLTLAREQWPWVRRMLAWCKTLVDERGLFVTDEDNGLDWDWYDGPKTGAVTAYNAAYHQTLICTANLAQALDLPDEADSLRQQAETLRAAANRHLYDAERHLYRLSDQMPSAIALDGNALAVVSGLAPDGEAEAILAALDGALPQTPYGPSPFSEDTGFWPQVSPYVCDMYLRALFSVGATEKAVDLIHRLWGHMATADQHAVGTAWELVGTDGSPGFGAKTSLAHGWAAGATAALSAHVLGVEPASPGFAIWRIRPQPGELTWAHGRVPTPHGGIKVSWTRDGDRLVLDLTVPEGTRGTVTVPLADEKSPLEITADAQQGPPHRSVYRHGVRGAVADVAITAGGRYRVIAG